MVTLPPAPAEGKYQTYLSSYLQFPEFIRMTERLADLVRVRTTEFGSQCLSLWTPHPDLDSNSKIKNDDFITALGEHLEIPPVTDPLKESFGVRRTKQGWVFTTHVPEIYNRLLANPIQLELPVRSTRGRYPSSPNSKQTIKSTTFTFTFSEKRDHHQGDRVCFSGLPHFLTKEDCSDLLKILGGGYSHFSLDSRKQTLEVWFTSFPRSLYLGSDPAPSIPIFPGKDPLTVMYRTRLSCSLCMRAGHSHATCPFSASEKAVTWADRAANSLNPAPSGAMKAPQETLKIRLRRDSPETNDKGKGKLTPTTGTTKGISKTSRGKATNPKTKKPKKDSTPSSRSHLRTSSLTGPEVSVDQPFKPAKRSNPSPSSNSSHDTQSGSPMVTGSTTQGDRDSPLSVSNGQGHSSKRQKPGDSIIMDADIDFVKANNGAPPLPANPQQGIPTSNSFDRLSDLGGAGVFPQ